MKTRIFNLIIIDESGSMQSIKTAAIDSVNETIQTIRSAQKKHDGNEEKDMSDYGIVCRLYVRLV